jgi:hypothetical protein
MAMTEDHFKGLTKGLVKVMQRDLKAEDIDIRKDIRLMSGS